MKNNILLFIFGLGLLLTVAGCGGGNDLQGRKPVSGTVTLNGTPLADGEISFEPIGSQKIKSRSGCGIKNGNYSLKGEFGLVPGEYAVIISSMEEVPGSRTEGADPMNSKAEYHDIVPPKFGSASEQKVTVTDSGKQVFDFKM